MQRIFFLFTLFIFMMFTFSGCSLIADIFKAGVWIGVLIVILIIVLIVFLIRKMSQT